MPVRLASKFAVNALVAIAIFSISSFASAVEQAATPDQLLVHLMQSARAGDVQAFLAGMTDKSRQAIAETIAQRAAMEQAQHRFQQALDQQFGKGAPMLTMPPLDLKSEIARLAAVEVIDRKRRPDGAVELRVKTAVQTDTSALRQVQQTLVAVQEKGSWKLSLAYPTDAQMPAEREKAAERLIQEVRNGQYPDRFSAMLALTNAWANQGGGRR